MSALVPGDVTFWMIARAVLDPKICPFEHQRALIVYHLLFSGNLLISDSDLINNAYLRISATKDDRFVKSLLEHRLISIAVRASSGQGTPLSEVAEQIGQSKGGLLPSVAELSQEDLTYFDDAARIYPYDLAVARPRYEAEMLRILRNTDFGDKLPRHIANEVANFGEQTIKLGGALGWSTFTPASELWTVVQQRLSDHDLKANYATFLTKIARGPYATFLPGSMGLSAAYSSEDKVGIDLLRGRHDRTATEMDRCTVRVKAMNLADTIGGLSQLTAGDIMRLRASQTGAAYEKACLALTPEHPNLDEVKRSFFTYRAEVNSAIRQAIGRGHRMEEEQLTMKISLLKRASSKIQEVVFQAPDELCLSVQQFTQSQLAAAMNPLLDGYFSAGKLGYARIMSFMNKQVEFTKERDERLAIHHRMSADENMLIEAMPPDQQAAVKGEVVLEQNIRDLYTSPLHS